MPEISLKLNFNPTLDAAKLNVLIRNLKAALGPLGRDIKLIDGAAMKREFETVTSEVIEATGELKTLQTQIDTLKKKAQGSDLPRTFRANEMVTSIRNVADAVKGFTDVGVTFENDLAKVGKITGQTGEDLDALGDRGRELGIKFGGGASPQLAVFQGILSKLGPQVAKDQAALTLLANNVNVLSKAGDMAADVSMQSMIDAMLQFGLVTGDASTDAATSTRVINALAASAEVGSAEIPQVAESMIETGNAAKNANISLEMTTAAIQAIALGGKYGSQAGIGLRNVLGLMQKAAGPAADELKRMGISSEELGRTLTEEGLEAALTKVRAGLNTYGSDAERNAAMITIFGQENSTVAGVLLDNIDKLQEYHDGIIAGQQGAGTAVEQAAQQMDTAQGKIDRALAWLQDKGITAFKLLGSNASAALSVVSQMAPQLAGLSSIKNLIPPGAISSIGTMAKSMLTTLLPALFTTNATTGVLTFSFGALWTAITGPIGIAVAAIVAIGAALWLIYENVEPVRTAIDGVIAFLTPVFEQLWEVIKVVGDVLWEVGKIMFEWFITPWQIAYNVIVTVVTQIWDFIAGLVSSGTAAKTAGGFMAFFNTAIKYVLGSLKLSKGLIRGSLLAIKEFKNVIFDVFGALSKMSFADILKGIFTGDFGKAGKVLSEAGSRIGKAFKTGVDEVMIDSAEKVEETVKPPAKTTTKPPAKTTTKPPPGGGGTGDKDAAKKAAKLQADVDKFIDESRERIAKIAAERDKEANERTLAETEELQDRISENYALSAEERQLRWIELESERVTKILAMQNAAIDEEKRVALKAIDDRLADSLAKEGQSEQQKTAIRNAMAAERSATEAAFTDKLNRATEAANLESGKRIADNRKTENDRALEETRTRLDREAQLYERAIDKAASVQKRLNEVFASIGTRATEQSSDQRIEEMEQQKDREIEIVGDNEAAKAEVERFYAARRATIEEESARRIAAIEAVKGGQDLFVDRAVDLDKLRAQKSQLEDLLSITPPESEAALRLRQQLGDVENTLAEKADVMQTLTGAIQEDFAAGMAGLFSGDQEAMQEGMRKTLGTIAGFLQQLATSAVLELVLTSAPLKAIAASAAWGAPLVLASAAAVIRAGINAILSPILSSVLSFATGGRVDSPTLAVIGDAGKATGSNTEWILRDPDIADIVRMAQQPMTEALVAEMRLLRQEVVRLGGERTVLRGQDLVTATDRAKSAANRRRRS
jgi:TP901 family phage tail tape measure protein